MSKLVWRCDNTHCNYSFEKISFKVSTRCQKQWFVRYGGIFERILFFSGMDSPGDWESSFSRSSAVFVSQEDLQLRSYPYVFLLTIKTSMISLCLADSPLYLSKSIRIRQIRAERKECHTRITQLFPSSLSPSCFVGGNNLMKAQSSVIGGQRHCSSWQLPLSNSNCSDVCNYTTVWSALAYKQRTRLYVTRESPWYFLFHLLPEETVGEEEIFNSRTNDFLSNSDWTVQSKAEILRFE